MPDWLIFILELGAMILLIVLSAFCSSAEMSLFSLSRAKVLSYADSKSKAERRIHSLMTDYQQTLITIILCNMFANSLISMLNDSILKSLQLSPVLTTVLSAFTGVVILLLFGEITPMTAAYIYSDPWSKIAAGPVWLMRRILSPLTSRVEKICGRVQDFMGRKQETGLRPEEFLSFIDVSQENNVLTREEAGLLRETFALRRKTVGSVIRVRTATGFIHADDTPENIAEAIRKYQQAYFPVSAWKSLDTAEYILSVRDFFSIPLERRKTWLHGLCVNSKTLFIPAGTTLEKALKTMKKHGKEAALAVDEYGAVCGTLSLGDIYSELAGRSLELDENEEFSPIMIRNGVWLADGLSSPDVLRSLNGPDLASFLKDGDGNDDNNDPAHCSRSGTINGLFCRLYGAIPHVGDRVAAGSVVLTVRKISGNCIRRLVIDTTGNAENPLPDPEKEMRREAER